MAIDIRGTNLLAKLVAGDLVAIDSHVQGVVDAIENQGNPLPETSTNIYALDTKEIVPDAVVQAIRIAEDMDKTS